MKFSDKYEILEIVTSGRVSTFLARERTTQDPVVVYTFECVGTGAGDLSTASIISRFCSLAPNPPGMIVKAGFDGPSSSAFITTKMPDSAALKAWVAAYQSFVVGAAKSGSTASRPAAPAPSGANLPVAGRGTAPVSDATVELSAFEVKSVMSKGGAPQRPPQAESPAGEVAAGTDAFSLGGPAPAPSQSGGEFTRLFNEVNAFQPVRSAPPPVPPKLASTDPRFGERLGGSYLGEKPAPVQPSAPPPAESSPGSFTREFLGISNLKAEPAALNPVPGQTQATEPPLKTQGAFTREFLAQTSSPQTSSHQSPKSAETPAPRSSAPSPSTSFDSIFGSASSSEPTGAESSKGGAGEFTSFFRDPFEHPQAPEKSLQVPDFGAPPPKKEVGDFTRVFGRSDLEQAAPEPMSNIVPEPEPAAGSFTQVFGGPPSRDSGSQLGASTLGTDPSLRPSFFDPQPAPPVAPAPPRVSVSSTSVPLPPDPFLPRTPTAGPPAANQPFMNRPASVEPTDMFRMPASEPPAHVAPSGPSEFTVFLSKGQLEASLAAASAPPPITAPPGAPPPFQFAPPPAPALPTPSGIKFPSVPGRPAAPTMSRPAVPAMPAAAPAAPKGGSIWPLITGLVVLVMIGIMLVMYFALKH